MSYERLFWLLHEQPQAEAEASARRAVAEAPATVVSACLVGIPCRYDGTSRRLPNLETRLEGCSALPLCPEVLAGLGTPRRPMSFIGGDGRAALLGRVVLADEEGRDCTSVLREAARFAVQLARAAGCREALLKERSPSCGVHQVHTRQGIVDGVGMFTAALLDAGIKVRSEED